MDQEAATRTPRYAVVLDGATPAENAAASAWIEATIAHALDEEWNPWTDRLMGGGVALLCTLVAVALHAVPQSRGGLVAVLSLGAYFAGMYAQRWHSKRYWRRRRVLTYADKPRHERGPVRFQLDEDGITLNWPRRHDRQPWSDFVGAEAWQGLMMIRESRFHCIVIPLRVFAGPEQATEALAYVRERIAAARGQEPALPPAPAAPA